MSVVQRLVIVSAATVSLAACSGTQIEDQDEAELAETDKQVEADAKSLEEAADEAVKVLEEEVESELADEGVGSPPPPLPEPQENNEL